MATDVLRENNGYVESLQTSVHRGTHTLDVVPGLVIHVVEGDRWRERFVRARQSVVRFDDFGTFTESPLPDGLGISLDHLRKLCRDDAEAIDAIDRATRMPVGTNQHRKPFDNVQGLTADEKAPTGNRSDTALRRLRDARPDLHARVLARDLSPHAAMREAGFRKPTLTVRLDDPTAMARSIARHVDRDFISELIGELHHVADGMEK